MFIKMVGVKGTKRSNTEVQGMCQALKIPQPQRTPPLAFLTPPNIFITLTLNEFLQGLLGEYLTDKSLRRKF